MSQTFLSHLSSELDALQKAGLFKEERKIASPQAGTVTLSSGKSLINLCGNNYLGLSSIPS